MRATAIGCATNKPQLFLVLSTCVCLIVSANVLWGAPGDQHTNRFDDGSQTFDLGASAIPRLVEADYIELSKIASISRFRSAEGHDYSDAFETCRSMKHYFEPATNVDWSAVKIFSPVTGSILRTDKEWAGTKLEIQARNYRAFVFIIYHVNLSEPLHPGDKVVAGQVLGSHFGKETYSDIAVRINTPGGHKLVSYFEVIPDSVFQAYRRRGVATNSELIISKQARDADPLGCMGGNFTTQGHIPGWLTLEPPR